MNVASAIVSNRFQIEELSTCLVSAEYNPINNTLLSKS